VGADEGKGEAAWENEGTDEGNVGADWEKDIGAAGGANVGADWVNVRADWGNIIGCWNLWAPKAKSRSLVKFSTACSNWRIRESVEDSGVVAVVVEVVVVAVVSTDVAAVEEATTGTEEGAVIEMGALVKEGAEDNQGYPEENPGAWYKGIGRAVIEE
jgi:hypothetical protein